MLTNDQKKAIETMAARFRRAEPGAAEEATASRLARLAAVRQSSPAGSAPAPGAAPNEDMAADEAPAAGDDIPANDETPAASEAPAPEAAAEPACAPLEERRPAPVASAPKPADPAEDERWSRDNLRWRGDRPVLDMANVLRILDRHEDFAGRFRYNDSLNKVMDKGAVMLDWRLAEVCAAIQERFMPEIAEADVQRALLIHANRKSRKK